MGKRVVNVIMNKNIATVILLMVIPVVMHAQPHYYQAYKSFSVAAGYSNIHNNADNFQVAFLEGTYYMSYQMGWEFSARVEYGKNYLSFEPVGLLGLPMWIYSSSHGLGRESNMIGALLSIASAKLPIAVDSEGIIEITPYWSLLKLTRFYDDKFRINGDLGLQVKLFPIALFKWSSTLYISGFVQWDWGYSRNHNNYGRYNIKDNRSDFFGYAWGVQLGYYF